MRLEAHRHGEKLALFVRDADYNQANGIRQAVNASRYSKALSARDEGTFAFLYPLTPDKCTEMREAWGADLKVTKELGAWYREAMAVRSAQVARTKATDASLPRLSAAYPALNEWLKGDQRVTASWIANAYRGAGLLADEVGTGKTAGVIAGLVEAGVTGSVLIVCPKISVKAVWFREITKHTDIQVFACTGTRARRQRVIDEFINSDPDKLAVLVVVSEMLRVKAHREKGRIVDFLGHEYPDLFDVDWNAVVIDESHKVLGAMDIVKANLAGEGIKLLHYAPNALRLAVSATPFGRGGRTEALFGTLHWLWPDEFTGRWAWLKKYFEVWEEQVFVRGGGGATKPVMRVGDVINEEKLWRDLGPRVLRRTMEEVSPEHRGLKNYIEVLCQLEGPQLTQYKRFAQDAELAVEGGIISTVGVLDYMIRARQFANGVLRKEGGRVVYTGASAKIDQLLLHLENRAPGRKVVIASQYNEFLDVVQRRLEKEGYGMYRLDGSTTDRRRQDIMSAFQGEATYDGPRPVCPTCQAGKGKPHGAKCQGHDIFLLNTQAGGVSITLDAADELHAMDESDPDSMTQLFGRVFRRGRVHEVFLYLYRAMGTIDEEIGYRVANALEKQKALLDGRRGVAYARELAQYKGEEA